MTIDPKKYVAILENEFSRNSNLVRSAQMNAYMKNKFQFYGIKSALRNSLQRDFLKENGKPEPYQLEEIVNLLRLKPREMQYFAIDLMRKMLRDIDVEYFKTLEFLLTNKSWWDSVDELASAVCGPLFQKFPDQLPSLTDRWSSSNNMWLQRTSIIFQLTYKQDTSTQLLVKYIEMHIRSNEFFIRKAIGWALRQYSKTNLEWVKHFVESHELSGLSKREASKFF